MPDEPQLTDATKAEQEFGRKMAAQNASALERALKARDAEAVQLDDEAQAAVDEALQQAETRKPQAKKEKVND